MTDKGLMIQCLKSKHISINEMIETNYPLFNRITKAMNEYHQAKLKLLGIGGVIDCNHNYQRTERGGEFLGNKCDCGEWENLT